MKKLKSIPDRQLEAASSYHQAVLLAEVVEGLAPILGETIVDGTLGGGGHTRALLAAGAKIVGLDQDIGALGHCATQSVVYNGDSVSLVQTNFRWLDDVLNLLKIDQVNGLLLDLGVSSRQIDLAERGFSFQKEGPLDMRMNRFARITAAEIVNSASQDELARTFFEYGEEPAARRIAAAVVRRRQVRPFKTTLELAHLIEEVVPKRGPRHPATKAFQALRIQVNDEINALHDVLESACRRLKPGGRIGVITFHSLEDRIVKNFCRETSNPTIDRAEWPQPLPNPRYMFRSITRKVIQATPEEVARNPRARSAKLRVMERNSSSFSPRMKTQPIIRPR